MARVKLSNRKGWVRLKLAEFSDFSHGDEFVVKHGEQYLVASIPLYSKNLIAAKYKNDLIFSPKEVEIYKIV